MKLARFKEQDFGTVRAGSARAKQIHSFPTWTVHIQKSFIKASLLEKKAGKKDKNCW